MSDVGIYDVQEAELIAALSTPAISGVQAIVKTLSPHDLIERDAARFPVIGVNDDGAKDGTQLYANARPVMGTVLWQVIVAVIGGRGAVAVRSTSRTLRETARDRIHYLLSAGTGNRYLWKSDEYVDLSGFRKDLVVTVSTFEIQTRFGR